jgi:hypothetical protein
MSRALAFCAADLEHRIKSWLQALRSGYAKLKDA